MGVSKFLLDKGEPIILANALSNSPDPFHDSGPLLFAEILDLPPAFFMENGQHFLFGWRLGYLLQVSDRIRAPLQLSELADFLEHFEQLLVEVELGGVDA